MADFSISVSPADFAIAVSEGRVDTVNNIYHDKNMQPYDLSKLAIDETSDEITTANPAVENKTISSENESTVKVS